MVSCVAFLHTVSGGVFRPPAQELTNRIAREGEMEHSQTNPRSVESERWRSRQLGHSAAMQFRTNFVQRGVASAGTQKLRTAVPIRDEQKLGRRRNKNEREELQSSCGRLLSSQRYAPTRSNGHNSLPDVDSG